MSRGENDDEKTISDIVQAVSDVGLSARFNLVRYNPYSQAQGKAPEEWVLYCRLNQMNNEIHVQGSRIVPRVGFDIKASCGMFWSASEQN